MISPTELWGTFAVDDHLRQRAFVAEVLLFDRLIIPHPPKGDPARLSKWIEAGWQPERLEQSLKTLGSLAFAVEWSDDLIADWRHEYKAHLGTASIRSRIDLGGWARFDLENIKKSRSGELAMFVTRELLANKLNNPADEVLFEEIKRFFDVDPTADIEAVVGYGSRAKFDEELKIDQSQGTTSGQPNTAFLFRWDFVVPEDSDLSDSELLERAIKISAHSEFRESRKRFHDWRRRLIEKSVTVEEAQSEMNRCLTTYNSVVAKSNRRARILTALQVIAVAFPLADFVIPGLGAVGGVTIGLGSIFLQDKLLAAPSIGEREKIAAIVHDSREAFGWHLGDSVRHSQ